ncbi:transposase [Deinococcus sp. QL22]|uniref:transposase n=1 Tax=Deinococcus sp. QL22 TaxID=2939437 RepID=UPI002016F3C1|nr:transposase [Deinococcus sp. QL22]UQN09201.1 transposase [Deinococcus sp. QL22]
MVDAQNAARALMANPELPPFQRGVQQRHLQDLTHAQRKLSQEHQAHKATLTSLDLNSPVRPVLEMVMTTLQEQRKVLERHLKDVVSSLLPALLNVQGVGPVVAGIVLGEIGRVERFKNKHHFASYCGAAPVERGSGQNTRMQLNTSGYRRLNWALHIIAIVRLRQDERTKSLVTRLKSQGKSQRKALRILKTYIARELFTLLQQAAASKSPEAPVLAGNAT